MLTACLQCLDVYSTELFDLSPLQTMKVSFNSSSSASWRLEQADVTDEAAGGWVECCGSEEEEEGLPTDCCPAGRQGGAVADTSIQCVQIRQSCSR